MYLLWSKDGLTIRQFWQLDEILPKVTEDYNVVKWDGNFHRFYLLVGAEWKEIPFLQGSDIKRKEGDGRPE